MQLSKYFCTNHDVEKILSIFSTSWYKRTVYTLQKHLKFPPFQTDKTDKVNSLQDSVFHCYLRVLLSIVLITIFLSEPVCYHSLVVLVVVRSTPPLANQHKNTPFHTAHYRTVIPDPRSSRNRTTVSHVFFSRIRTVRGKRRALPVAPVVPLDGNRRHSR